VIAHVVLFRPRPDLTDAQRADFLEALGRALREIPSVRRSRVGRRVTFGRGYEQLMQEHFEYAAIIEFDDVDGLKAYLQHPEHEWLAQRFFSSSEAVLVYDYEVKSGDEDVRWLR
jgi:hypothetical protein